MKDYILVITGMIMIASVVTILIGIIGLCFDFYSELWFGLYAWSTITFMVTYIIFFLGGLD